MELEKYVSPFPGRKIEGKDFNDLSDYVNQALEKIVFTNSSLREAAEKLKKLDEGTAANILSFQKELATAQDTLCDIEKRNNKLSRKLRNFYSRQIELFGIFIAIFSFIIAGIQIATKLEGTFQDVLLRSTAIFIPVIAAIIILLVATRLTFR
jgi:hypothetical protein